MWRNKGSHYWRNNLLHLIDFLMKLFKTTNVEVVQACREVFHCELSSVQLTERNKIFMGLNDHCDYLQ